MEIEVTSLSGFLKVRPKIILELVWYSFGLIRDRSIHEMIGLVKVRDRIKGQGPSCNKSGGGRGLVEIMRSVWVILEKDRVLFINACIRWRSYLER